IINIIQDEMPIEDEFLGMDVEPEPGMEIEIIPLDDEPEVFDDTPRIFVEEMPSFHGGGLEAFRSWIIKNLKYPELAAENRISGKVFVQFVVNSRGKVEDVVVIRGVDPALNNEAIRVIKSSPKWIPGKQSNRAVKVQFTRPINFVLQ
ncbi:MAG: energy transducer TonB, partial [Bacteroidales bacterium]|nr:energy transducer TonB [Bacteroidales bacterium]